MNAPLPLALIATAAVALGWPTASRTTVPERDAVRFEGRQELMMEVPLNHLLGGMHDLPPFEWQRTSNWKG